VSSFLLFTKTKQIFVNILTYTQIYNKIHSMTTKKQKEEIYGKK